MKKKIMIIASIFLLSALIGIVIITSIVQILVATEFSKNSNDDKDGIEHFEIMGRRSGNTHNLNFIFDSWNIKGIKANLSGNRSTLNTKVDMPKVSGTNEAVVYQVLRRAEYTHAASCGIMGNIRAESGFNACILEGQNSWTSGRSANARGYGLCQWTNTTPPYTRGRRTNCINWLKSHGYNPSKNTAKLAEGQTKYMLIEPGYDAVRNRVKKEKDISKATEAWLRGFEGIFNQATYNSRVSYAKDYDREFRNKNFSKSGNTEKASLNLRFNINANEISFSGKLAGIDIAGYYSVKGNNISGAGEYGEGASSGEGAGFTGTLSGANATQRRVVLAALSYKDPYSQGFAHMCELWVYTVFKKAGLNYRGSCCASHSRDKNATNRGKIPVGAAIYSGNYHSSVHCGCGRNAGHVAIYVGNGQVAGSQIPFKMSLEQWKAIFGYGGWYFPKN